VSKVIRLNMNALELSVLYNGRETLASVGTKNWCGWEFEIKGADKVAGWIAEEADTGALLLVERLTPGVHAGICLLVYFKSCLGSGDLHERIVDGDDENFAGVLQLSVGNVVWDVRVCACWA
jgi:hypothetical protein